MEELKGERLYKDYTHLDSGYTTWNIDLLPAINNKYTLSKLDIMLFLDIAMSYSNGRTPQKYSYEEYMEKYICCKKAVFNSINNLIDNKLIIEVGERKGRAKRALMPNVAELHKILENYIKARSVVLQFP